MSTCTLFKGQNQLKSLSLKIIYIIICIFQILNIGKICVHMCLKITAFMLACTTLGKKILALCDQFYKFGTSLHYIYAKISLIFCDKWIYSHGKVVKKYVRMQIIKFLISYIKLIFWVCAQSTYFFLHNISAKNPY